MLRYAQGMYFQSLTFPVPAVLSTRPPTYHRKELTDISVLNAIKMTAAVLVTLQKFLWEDFRLWG